MTKPPKKPTETPSPELDNLPEDDPGELVEQAAAELIGGGGGTVRIERLAKSGQWEFVDEWSAESFTLREVQQTFGGGDYYFRVRDAQKRYRKQIRKRLAELPASLLKGPAVASAVDPIAAALAKQTELLAQLLAKLSTPQPQADARAGLLDDLVKFKTILGGGERSGNSFKEAMDMVSTAMEFSKKIGSGGETSGWDVLEELIAQAGEPVGRAIEAAVQAVRGRQLNGAPRVLPKAPEPIEGTAMKIPPRYVALLVEKAVEGSDPTLYADLILDNVPEDMIRGVLEGGIVTALGAVDARVKDHAQWFEQLGAVLSDALKGSDVSESGGAAPGDS